jgi:hypothetical protein
VFEHGRPVAFCDQFVHLRQGQLEQEVVGESVAVATDLFLH